MVGASEGTPESEEELSPGLLTAAVPANVGWSSSARNRSGCRMDCLSLQAGEAVAGGPRLCSNLLTVTGGAYDAASDGSIQRPSPCVSPLALFLGPKQASRAQSCQCFGTFSGEQFCATKEVPDELIMTPHYSLRVCRISHTDGWSVPEDKSISLACPFGYNPRPSRLFLARLGMPNLKETRRRSEIDRQACACDEAGVAHRLV